MVCQDGVCKREVTWGIRNKPKMRGERAGARKERGGTACFPLTPGPRFPSVFAGVASGGD